MFISAKKKIIFLHCPKTAGTSFRKLLSDNSENDAWSLIKDELKEHVRVQRKHLPSLIAPHWGTDVLTHLNISLNDYHVITFVRNPWDRFISLYKFIASEEKHHLHETATAAGIDRMVEFLILEGKTPEHFPQHAYYDAHFEIPNLHVLQSENFSNEIRKVSERFNLRLNGIPHLNKSIRQKIKLSKRIESLIGYHEFKTIEKFNYMPAT